MSDPILIGVIAAVCGLLVGAGVIFILARFLWQRPSPGGSNERTWTVADFDEIVNAPIRPSVFLIFSVAFVVGFFVDKITGDVFNSVFLIMMGFFFGKRESANVAAQVKTAHEQAIEQIKEIKKLEPGLPPATSSTVKTVTLSIKEEGGKFCVYDGTIKVKEFNTRQEAEAYIATVRPS